MKVEKLVISFIAVSIGILVAALAFYFYQTTKIVSTNTTKTITTTAPTPPSDNKSESISLTVDSPSDESVVSNKTVSISGKTTPDAVVVISTKTSDSVVTPAVNGSFSTTIVLDDGENNIIITAISKNGNETKIVRTVTYSTETF